MDDSDLLAFSPVPLRSRRDGWTAGRQRAFILAVRRGLRPGTAARAVGMSRQTAYALRRRPGGESFAAAWDAVAAAAQRERGARRSTGSEFERAVTGVLHPIRYRRRIVAVERRFDDRALVRLLGRVDRYFEKRGFGPGDYLGFGMPDFCQLPRGSPARSP